MRAFSNLLSSLLCAISINICIATGAFADLPGSQDPASIKRYEGSEIIRYEKLAFESFTVPLGKMTKFDFGTKVAEFEKSEVVEGQLTRISYRVPDPDRSSLEVFRNYQSALKEGGWEILWSASGKAQFGNAFAHIYESLRDNDQLFTYNDQQAHFLSARKVDEGLTATLFVTKFEMGLKRGLTVNKGDPIIHLDVIASQKMEQRMVVVPASEMAKELDQRGSISLYGIYFDFNKSELKTESDPTLQEIAVLLRDKPTLRIVVAGHTDSVGTFPYNRDLSQKRADAVVTALTDRFGIASDRLVPFGVSSASPVASNSTEEGRSKNRRVEIVALN